VILVGFMLLVPNSKCKTVDRGKMVTFNTHYFTHDRSHSWLGINTSIKTRGLKLLVKGTQNWPLTTSSDGVVFF
jgi:hypothetical protein